MPVINELAAWSAVGAGSLFMLATLLQKFLVSIKTDKTEGSVMSIMHQELGRMAEHNKILSEELNKLQIKILALNTQLTALTQENQRLDSEILVLTGEIGRLQAILTTDRGLNNASKD